MDKLRILVTYCAPWDMTAQGGGKGCTVNYFIAGNNNEYLQATNDVNQGVVGFQSAKCTVDSEKREQYSFVPGFYDATFTMKVGSDRKPVSVLDNVEFVSQVDFVPSKPRPEAVSK